MELVQTVITNPWVVEAMKVPNFLGVLLALVIYRIVGPVIDLVHPVNLILGACNIVSGLIARRQRLELPNVVPAGLGTPHSVPDVDLGGRQ